MYDGTLTSVQKQNHQRGSPANLHASFHNCQRAFYQPACHLSQLSTLPHAEKTQVAFPAMSIAQDREYRHGHGLTELGYQPKSPKITHKQSVNQHKCLTLNQHRSAQAWWSTLSVGIFIRDTRHTQHSGIKHMWCSLSWLKAKIGYE